MRDVTQAFLAACRAEIEAPKPGNVHVFADGHDMEARDFLKSAEAAAEYLTNNSHGVGRRILDAVKASMDAVGTNTNLGIVLLCVPLAASYDRIKLDVDAGKLDGSKARDVLHTALVTVLDSLDVTDSEQVYVAIRLANPGGMGKVKDNDLHGKPTKPLRSIMADVKDRDRIAKAYADGYADVFGLGLSTLENLPTEESESWWPATAVYLTFLSSFPDTHIIRKWGPEAAEWVRSEAEKLQNRLSRIEHRRLPLLLNFDQAIKARGFNPGTSADLTVATLFAKSLINILQRSEDSG